MKKELLIDVPVYEELVKLSSPKQLKDGREVLNPEPMYLPINERPPTLLEQIKRVLRTELSRNARNEGYESFEDADDFGEEDEEILRTPYEMSEMQEEFNIKSEPDIDEQSNPDQSSPGSKDPGKKESDPSSGTGEEAK